ncbi:helix-turn-helix domain-containing protein [Thalassobacter stenotrophicus]|uniref:helix-turn-helix domain-containing protein n=1 Tax=Thalassobacter stenotrophicus TaxID=266809 RepID=UPI0022A928B1|nr:helix-turn-helix domain-containing protein [Thalassobacter stenotrophicus]UYP67526.1 helix-turn-helix domain-containing protein [Thalassobacter stenotrophicus]
MSHAATNWAIQQRGLKPTTKIVLWHLCDRFNPDFGCFPTQARLAHDCEISRSTLNGHLTLLERVGLIRRVQRLNPGTKRQMPTRYILAFEPGFTQDHAYPRPKKGHGHKETSSTEAEGSPIIPNPGGNPVDNLDPCPQSTHGAVSDFGPDPCPEHASSRVQNLDSNPVREPLRKPVKEEEDARAPATLGESFFEALLAALGFAPNRHLPGWWQGWPPREHVRRWHADLGLNEEEILEVAGASRQEHPEPPDGPKALDRLMQRAAQRKAQAKAASDKPRRQECKTRRGTAASGPAPCIDELASFYAERVKGNGYLPPSMISNAMCQAMLERELVTREQLQMRGVL